LPLNLDKFEELCHKTGELIVDNYPWLPMTATVHKILVHSKQLLENTVFPAGAFGEEAAEARNKIYKSDRLHHARKQNRICGFTDVFHRAMETSDPIISSINLNRRIQKHKRLPLSHACDFKPAEDFVDGADDHKEDHYDFSYNIEIENKEHIE